MKKILTILVVILFMATFSFANFNTAKSSNEISFKVSNDIIPVSDEGDFEDDEEEPNEEWFYFYLLN